MNVIQIPTNKPVIRKDLDDKLYKTAKAKFEAIVEEVENIHKTGQPILIGTSSIQKSEIVSYLLSQKGLKHEVLNAKNHEKEAQIIAKAGKLNAITVATNMAGRGTDIALGDKDENEEEQVKLLGGLYVIGTEKHENRRIDNQLKGRSGRQGDTGISQFYVSLEDDLMRLFSSARAKKIAEGIETNDVITNKTLTKSIESSQKNIESRNFEIRKQVLKYDDVINKQRKLVYEDRQRVLFEDNHKETIEKMIKFVLELEYNKCVNDDNVEEFTNQVKNIFKIEDLEITTLKDKKILEEIENKIIQKYNQIEENLGADFLRNKEKLILLRVIDMYWVEHLDAIEQLKKVVGLAAIAQKDPLKEFTMEAFDIFEEMGRDIKLDTVRYLFN